MSMGADNTSSGDVPGGTKSALFEAFIDRRKILEGRPCRVRMRDGDDEGEG
jgi:hypothetical protein